MQAERALDSGTLDVVKLANTRVSLRVVSLPFLAD